MRPTVRRSLVAAAAAAAVTVAVGPAAIAGAAQPGAPQFGSQGGQGGQGSQGGQGGQGGHAVFVQSDSPGGNQILVLAQHHDGRLSERETVATGGLGGLASGAAVDELASQDSLVYDASRQLLFAVNAGSNTVSVLSAQGRQLRLLQVVSSGGTFPDSIAVSGNLVYVLNAGGSGTLTGYRLVGAQLAPIPGSSQSLGLSNSTPPNFLAVPGRGRLHPQRFRADRDDEGQHQLPRRVRRQPGRSSAAPTVTADPGNVPFSFTFSASGQLVVAEAGPSALHTFALGAGGSLTSVSSSVPDGQAALCWITAAGGYDYVANAGSNSVSAYAVAPNGTPSLVGTTGVVGTTDAGPIDMAASADGSTLYVEAGGAGAVDEFHLNAGGSLADLGSVAGLGAGIEGIATD